MDRHTTPNTINMPLYADVMPEGLVCHGDLNLLGGDVIVSLVDFCRRLLSVVDDAIEALDSARTNVIARSTIETWPISHLVLCSTVCKIAKSEGWFIASENLVGSCPLRPCIKCPCRQGPFWSRRSNFPRASTMLVGSLVTDLKDCRAHLKSVISGLTWGKLG